MTSLDDDANQVSAHASVRAIDTLAGQAFGCPMCAHQRLQFEVIPMLVFGDPHTVVAAALQI